MSRIELAGFNVDSTILDELVAAVEDPPLLTPETLSAAYARISRDPRPIGELRRVAREDVIRARETNQRVVFGLGHSSVAEHCVFNFDVLDVSRLAIEYLEAHRLASYTEKSQRYVRLGEDYLVPAEVDFAGLAEPFRAYVLACFRRYDEILASLFGRGVDVRLAGEDARYVLPLAVLGQLGMTLNARSLEHLILRLAGNPLAEVRDLADQFLKIAGPIAPSLLRYMDPGPYHLMRPRDIAQAAIAVMGAQALAPAPGSGPRVGDVCLVHATPDGDATILAALVQTSLGCDFGTVLARVTALGHEERLQLFEAATMRMGIHDALPREFEHGSMTFELTLSAAAYGQFKRHRLASLTVLPYDPALGLTIPPAIAVAGLSHHLEDAAREAADLAERLGGYDVPGSSYAWLNAHRRRALMTVNLREFYHISRLREDEHAQWDIRGIVASMSEIVRKAFPVCASLLGGKDQAAERIRSRQVPRDG
jgi:flavin-dependent thymidylate synthase